MEKEDISIELKYLCNRVAMLEDEIKRRYDSARRYEETRNYISKSDIGLYFKINEKLCLEFRDLFVSTCSTLFVRYMVKKTREGK